MHLPVTPLAGASVAPAGDAQRYVDTKAIMRAVGFIALLACLASSAFAEPAPEIAGRYRSTDEGDSSSLELRVDGSLSYQLRGGSCWSWADVHGQWNSVGSAVELFWDVKVEEDSTEVVCQAPAKRSPGVRVEVLNADNNPILGAAVTINHRDPSLETDSKGLVVIPKEETVDRLAEGNSAVEWIEIVSHQWSSGQALPPGYWSVGQSVDCPGYDSFTVVIDREPETTVERISQRYFLQNDTLLLTSSYDPYVEEPQHFATRLDRDTGPK